jgi:hypothetical protein
MRKITAFKISDGRLIENEAEALAIEKKMQFEAALSQFFDKHDYWGARETISELIIENAQELFEILSNR